MANGFDSLGGGAARGLQRGLMIRESRKSRELDESKQKAAEQEQRAKLFKESNDQARELAIQNATKFGEFAVQAAEKGATPEQLAEMRNGAMAALMEYGSTLEEYRKRAEMVGEDPNMIPSGKDFVEQNLQIYDAGVQAASIQKEEEQAQILPPDEVQSMGFPKGSVVQKKPDGSVSLVFEPASNDSVSALQEKVSALVASGVDEARALGIASGRYQISLDPTSREVKVIDMATGEPVGGAIEEPDPAVSDPPPALIPPGVDASEAAGAGGFLTNAVNVIGDSIGAGTADPKAQQATEALTSLQTYTQITLQAEVPGRPSNYLMEQMGKLTVTPNSLLQGEDRVKVRLEQTQRLVDGEIQRIEKEVLPKELPPAVRTETELNLTQMKRLREAYDDLLKNYAKDETEVAPEIQSILDKYPAKEKK